MTRQGQYGNRIGPITTTSTIMAQTFALAEADGIYLKDISNNDKNTISNWRRGDNQPSLLTAERVIDGLGYEVIVRKKGSHHE